MSVGLRQTCMGAAMSFDPVKGVMPSLVVGIFLFWSTSLIKVDVNHCSLSIPVPGCILTQGFS